jgi:flagellar hook assembly protein FlgD
LDVLTDVRTENKGIPTEYGLDPNYPNPFNPTTVINYALPRESRVTLRIYNIIGQKVVTLVEETRGAGYYEVLWDGRNEAGVSISSGVYFFRIDAVPTGGGSPFTQIRKMIMLK